MGDTPEMEKREADWRAEVALETYTEEMTPEEIQKKEDEKQKIVDQETEESKNVAKRKGYRIYIHGDGFVKTNTIKARFSWNDQVTLIEECIYKNKNLVASKIPDFGA
jgi:hypothetical protein